MLCTHYLALFKFIFVYFNQRKLFAKDGCKRKKKKKKKGEKKEKKKQQEEAFGLLLFFTLFYHKGMVTSRSSFDYYQTHCFASYA